MRLQNKLNQLVLGRSGKPRVFTITRVHLRKDGKVTGNAAGHKVMTDKLNNNMIWRFVDVAR